MHKIVEQGPCSAQFSISLFILVLFALVSFCRAAQKSANFFCLVFIIFHSMLEYQTSFFYLCLLDACKPLMSHFSSSSIFFSSGAIDWVHLPSNLAYAMYGACCKLWSFYNPWEATLAGFLCVFIWRWLYVLVCRRARPRIFLTCKMRPLNNKSRNYLFYHVRLFIPDHVAKLIFQAYFLAKIKSKKVWTWLQKKIFQMTEWTRRTFSFALGSLAVEISDLA